MEITTATVVAVWKAIGQQTIALSSTAVSDVLKNIKWEKAADGYTSRLRELYRQSRLFLFNRPIQLDEIYTDVEIFRSLSANRSTHSDGNLKGPVNRLQRNAGRERLKAEELILRETRLLLLGGPGAGKTTLLRHIAVQATRGVLGREYVIPVLIPLRELGGRSLQDAIEAEFSSTMISPIRDYLHQLFLSDHAIILLDGIDEVPSAGDQRSRLIREIDAFVRNYPGQRIVLTGRLGAVDYSFEHFAIAEIAEFTESQQEKFIEGWFRDSKSKCAAFEADWRNPQSDSLRELGTTPLLLALICLVFDEDNKLPHRKIELYEQALDVLIRKWDTSRGIRRDDIYKGIGYMRQRQLFEDLAFDTFAGSQYEFTTNEAVEICGELLSALPLDERDATRDVEAIVNAGVSHHGLLYEVGRGYLVFAHLTFHEYLTACHLARKPKSLDEIVQIEFDGYFDKRWHETFLMLASKVSDPKRFLATLETISVRLKEKALLFEVLFATPSEESVDSIIGARRLSKVEYEQGIEQVFMAGRMERPLQTHSAVSSAKLLKALLNQLYRFISIIARDDLPMSELFVYRIDKIARLLSANELRVADCFLPKEIQTALHFLNSITQLAECNILAALNEEDLLIACEEIEFIWDRSDFEDGHT